MLYIHNSIYKNNGNGILKINKDLKWQYTQNILIKKNIDLNMLKNFLLIYINDYEYGVNYITWKKNNLFYQKDIISYLKILNENQLIKYLYEKILYSEKYEANLNINDSISLLITFNKFICLENEKKNENFLLLLYPKNL